MNIVDEKMGMKNGFNFEANKYVEKLMALMGQPQNDRAEDKRVALLYLLAAPEYVQVRGKCTNRMTNYMEFPMSDGSDGYLYYLRLGVESLITQAYNARKELEALKKRGQAKPKVIVNANDNPQLFDARNELKRVNKELEEANSTLSGTLTRIRLQEKKAENLEKEIKKQIIDYTQKSSVLEELEREIEKNEKEKEELERKKEEMEESYKKRLSDLEGQYDEWAEQIANISKGVPIGSSVQNIGDVIQGFQNDLDRLRAENKGLEELLKVYQGLERVMVPELQQMLFTRSTQGKTIRLSAREIEEVFRMALNGYKDENGSQKEYSYYKIGKVLGVSHTTVKKLLDIEKDGSHALKDYCSVSSLEKIVKGLNLVSKNGNFSGFKKNKLTKYLNYYTSALEQAKKNKVECRAAFNSENGSFVDLERTIKELKANGKVIKGSKVEEEDF